MRAGTLDHRITIERKSVTQDPTYGSEVVTWVPLAPMPGSPTVGIKFAASVMDMAPSKSESVQQGLSIGRQQTRIRLRYRNDIDSSMRVIVHGDTDYILQIVGGPAMLGRKDALELMCEAFTS